MTYPEFRILWVIVVCSSLMLFNGLYLLSNFNKLFRRQVRNELLRKNIVVWMIAICIELSVAPLNPDTYRALSNGKWAQTFIAQLIAITLMSLFVFNITYQLLTSRFVARMTFRTKMATVLLTIISGTMLIGIPINYILNNGSFKNIELTLLYNFYTGCMTGLVYVAMSYLDLERQQKIGEKELEISRMRELKIKAELEALHSKINPHFLYNALNSIADLSVTDGRKARKMTVALADLFRYSINYSDHNYSTLNEEIAMTEVYLQIEKIRFEDQLNYSVTVGNALGHYLIPRFLLQPLMENAVKYGLKMTGRMTEIKLEVTESDRGFVIVIADNGPPFPDDLTLGYGIKSVFDKMDLLFPGDYEMHFINQPRKQVSILVTKLKKYEPGV